MKFKSSSCFRNTLAVNEILNKKLNHNILPLSNTVLNSVLESGKHVRETYTLSEAVLMPNHNQCFEQTQEKCQIVSTFFFFFFFFSFFLALESMYLQPRFGKVGLYWIHPVLPWFPDSVVPSFREHFVSVRPNFVCTSTLTRSSLGFSQYFDGVTALDCCQNFVSAQYLENRLTESDQILYAH